MMEPLFTSALQMFSKSTTLTVVTQSCNKSVKIKKYSSWYICRHFYFPFANVPSLWFHEWAWRACKYERHGFPTNCDRKWGRLVVSLLDSSDYLNLGLNVTTRQLYLRHYLTKQTDICVVCGHTFTKVTKALFTSVRKESVLWQIYCSRSDAFIIFSMEW